MAVEVVNFDVAQPFICNVALQRCCVYNGSVRVKTLYVIELGDSNDPASRIPLLCEREEGRQGSLETLEFRVSLVRKAHHSGGHQATNFAASYDETMGRISISSATPENGLGSILIAPNCLQGRGLGTYLMNEIIEWAKKWPHAAINQIRLSEQDATMENQARRNRFYEQFGICFEWNDEDKKSGKSLQMSPSSLNKVEMKPGLIVLPLDYFLTEYFVVKRKLQESERALDINAAALKQYRMASFFQRFCWVFNPKR